MRRRDLLLGATGLVCAPLLGGGGLAARALAQEDDHEPADPRRLSNEERRHVPVLVMPERVHAGRPFDLVIQIGVEPHVMSEAHRIERIELHVDDRRVFAAELGPGVAYPVVRVPVSLEQTCTVTARAVCNLHGGYRTRRRIEVR